MSQKIRCANPTCRRLFLPNPHVHNHQYCNRKDCQRVRKRRWQRQKMKNDPEYRDNQRDAQQCWMEQNRDYWRRYRDQHPEYVKRNRLLQREQETPDSRSCKDGRVRRDISYKTRKLLPDSCQRESCKDGPVISEIFPDSKLLSKSCKEGPGGFFRFSLIGWRTMEVNHD
jgi:hypothetical protein